MIMDAMLSTSFKNTVISCQESNGGAFFNSFTAVRQLGIVVIREIVVLNAAVRFYVIFAFGGGQ